MWKWSHCGKSESQAQFGLVVGMSDNSPVRKIPHLESFWGLGQGEPKVFSYFSIGVVVLKPACVQVRVCFIPPEDFLQELIFGWWAISSRQLPLFSGGFLFHSFHHKSCPLAILCCSFFILLGLCRGLGGLNLSCWKLQVDQSQEEGTPALLCL